MPIKLPKNSTYEPLGFEKEASLLSRIGGAWRGLSAGWRAGLPKKHKSIAYSLGKGTADKLGKGLESGEVGYTLGKKTLALGGTALAGLGGLAALAGKTTITGLSKEPLEGYSHREAVKRFGLHERVKADETLADSALKGFGQQLGKDIAGLVTGGASYGVSSAYDMAYLANKRRKVLNYAISSDDVLKAAPREQVQEAYNTLSRFAPTLAEDPNAVRSTLREAATYGQGMDYATIKNIAGTEDAVRKNIMAREALPLNIRGK